MSRQERFRDLHTPCTLWRSKISDEKHTLLDGKVHVYRRPRSSRWQCSTYLGGRNHRTSTKEENLALAIEFSREWYMLCYAAERRRRQGDMAARLEGTVQPYVGTDPSTDRRRRRTSKGPTFNDACEAFLAEYNISTQGERNAAYVAGKGQHINAHFLPFFGKDLPVSDITAGLIQEYRVHRQTSRVTPKTGEVKRPSRSKLHNEVVTLRQILKTANRKGWIPALPDMRVAYKASGKITHRAWFSPTEYKDGRRTRRGLTRLSIGYLRQHFIRAKYVGQQEASGGACGRVCFN